MNQKHLIQKQAAVTEIAKKTQDSASLIVFEYRGLSVAKITELRRQLREVDAEMVIYKNSLVERAVTELKHDGLHEHLVGPNAFIFSKDLIAGPKVIAKFARQNDEVVLKGALAEGRILDGDGVKTLAKLPGREGLISMFLSVLNAPISKFAATIQAVADAK